MKKLLALLVATAFVTSISLTAGEKAATKPAKGEAKACCQAGQQAKAKASCPMQQGGCKEKSACCSEGGKQAAKRPIDSKGGQKLAGR
jgi:hypothetical protein